MFDNEPDIHPHGQALNNVLLQAHDASGTVQTRHITGKPLRDNVAACFAGQPLLLPVLPEARQCAQS